VYTACQGPVLLVILGGYCWILRMPSANLLPLILFLVLFIEAVIAFSQAFGALFRSRQALLQSALFFSMPAFFLGGYTWPLEDMSPALRPLAAVLPTTPILNAWTTLTAIPDSFRWLGGGYLHQALLAVLYFGLSWLVLRTVIRRRVGKKTAA